MQIKIYDDEEGVRSAEVEKLGGTTQFSTFYERLKDIKDYHRGHPTAETTEPPDDDDVLATQVRHTVTWPTWRHRGTLCRLRATLRLLVQEDLQFTGEEMYGRYLDLHEFYHAYINLAHKARRGAKPAAVSADGSAASSTSGAEEPAMDYITFVQQFSHFHRVPRAIKFKAAYQDYVQALLRYLISFHERTIPLQPVVKLLAEVEDEFQEKWSAGAIVGWEDHGEGRLAADVDLVIDPDAFDSAQEVLELGTDYDLLQVAHVVCFGWDGPATCSGVCAGDTKVRAALAARNMKVGGTALQRAQRLMQAAGKQLHELPANVFVPGTAPAAALGEAACAKQLAAAKRLANIECKVLAVVESLGPVIDDTRAWVEKKLAQNYEELKQDIERDDFDIGGDADSDEVRCWLCAVPGQPGGAQLGDDVGGAA